MKEIENFKFALEAEGLNKNTIAAYLSRVNLFCQANVGAEVTQQSMAEYMQSISQLTNQTKNQTYYALKRLAKHLEIPFELVNDYRDFGYVNRKMPSDADLMTIWKVVQKEEGIIRLRNKAIISVLLYTGVRIDEARCLEMKDLDFEKKTLFVSTSKNKGARYLPLNSQVFEDLQAYIAERSRLPVDTDKVFITCGTNRRNTEMVYGAFRQLIKRVLRSANLEHLSPYCFRHAFATNLNKLGLAPEIISELMGHKAKDTALSFYIVPSPLTREEALEKLVKSA